MWRTAPYSANARLRRTLHFVFFLVCFFSGVGKNQWARVTRNKEKTRRGLKKGGGGGGSARAVRSARSASHLEPGLFLPIPRDLLVGHRLRCRSAFDSMSLQQARETSTAYRQTDWSQYISCIRYRIAWLPGGSGFGAVLHPVIVVVLKLLVVDRCPTRMSSISVWGSSQSGCTLDVTCSYSNVYITYQACDLIFCDRFVERLSDLLDLW